MVGSALSTNQRGPVELQAVVLDETTRRSPCVEGAMPCRANKERGIPRVPNLDSSLVPLDTYLGVLYLPMCLPR